MQIFEETYFLPGSLTDTFAYSQLGMVYGIHLAADKAKLCFKIQNEIGQDSRGNNYHL